MKKVAKTGLSLMIALAICLSLFPVAALATDTASSWAQTDVDKAIAAQLVPQALQTQYTQAITRGEFCSLAVALYETVKGSAISERTKFSDTTDSNVEKAAAIGVVSGVGDNQFSPNTALTREQASTMLARLAAAVGKPLTTQAATFSDNSSIAAWALEAVGQIQAAGVMSGVGDNAFAPQDAYTREQSIVTALRLYDIVKPETPKPETPKPETPKPETPKTETPKTETPKTETPKPDSGTQAQVSSCLKVKQDYGPFTMYDYSSNKIRRQTDVSSFVVTKLEMSSIEKYKMEYSIAGMSTKEDYHFFLCFYDTSGAEMGRQLVSGAVAPNQSFTRSDYAYIEAELIEDSAKIGFVSSSGDLADQARSGIDKEDSNNDKDDSSNDKNDDSGDDSKKFSLSDASKMNTWASAASKAANQCIGYANKALSAATSSDSTRSALYITQSKQSAQSAKDNLLKVSEILSNRVDATRQDGKTAAQICQEAIDALDAIINFEPETDVVGYSLKSVDAGACLLVQKFTVDLYGAFANN